MEVALLGAARETTGISASNSAVHRHAKIIATGRAARGSMPQRDHLCISHITASSLYLKLWNNPGFTHKCRTGDTFRVLSANRTLLSSVWAAAAVPASVLTAARKTQIFVDPAAFSVADPWNVCSVDKVTRRIYFN
jgi:hypothetical protein